VRTSIAQTVAEELDIDWTNVQVGLSKADRRFPNQSTGGSTSTRQTWNMARQAGATAREMLATAAAQSLNVPRSELTTEKGLVIHAASSRKLTYAELVPLASKVTPPQNPPLKEVDKFSIVGKPVTRVDAPDIVMGKAMYGLDYSVPDMLYAMMVRPPAFGAKIKSYDDSAAKAVEGVTHIVKIDNSVAVVGKNTWAALKARDLLKIEWDMGANATLDSTQIRQRLESAAGTARAVNGAKKIEAAYYLPYLAHATMEPMNCTVSFKDGKAVVYAPTQSPSSVQSSVAGIFGISTNDVTVYVTLMGGGFGRRSNPDFATEAAQIARTINAPVKLTWTRQDDMKHDVYRPASYHVLQGALNSEGVPTNWSFKMAASSLFGGSGMANSARRDFYRIQSNVEGVPVSLPIPVGFWRSVYSSQNVFAWESFFDEMAHAGGKDPFELRLQLMTDQRLKKVLEIAGDKAGWGKPLAEGRARGVAVHEEYGSYIAQIVELSVASTGKVKVHKVVSAVDVGIAINPSAIASQVEGCVIDGLSTTLKAEITIKNGGVEQNSFRDYKWFRIGDAPVMETHIVPSKSNPGGMGELAYPAVPPATANAIFAATGKRIRKLPVTPDDLK
jgi:isoquinoline 1-oxidoreductase beta subunit